MAVEKLKHGRVELVDNKLIINVIDPEFENPDIFQTIIAGCGRMQLVNEAKSTLEEVYLNFCKG